MSLQNWLANGWLTEHLTSRREIVDLLALSDRDLVQAEVPGLSADWRLAIAYNAALQAATAALAAAGYRSPRDAHHYRVLQSLALTIGADDDTVRRLDAFRKKRNISSYDRAGSVSDREAEEMVRLARNVRRDVELWLRQHHGAFMEPCM